MTGPTPIDMPPLLTVEDELHDVLTGLRALDGVAESFDADEQAPVMWLTAKLREDLTGIRDRVNAVRLGGAAGSTDPDAGLMGLCDAWHRLDAEQAAAPTDEEVDAVAERRRAVLEGVIPIRPRTSAGLAAKMRVLLEQAVLTDRLEPNSSRALVVDAYAIAGQPAPQPFMPWTDSEIAAKCGEAETPEG